MLAYILLFIFFLIVIFINYGGCIVSYIISLICGHTIKVGGFNWLFLSDVRLKLRNGLSIHIDKCSLQLFSPLFSKPILIKFGDVRIEGDSTCFRSAESKNNNVAVTAAPSGRLLQLVQYCGLSVNRAQLVLLDAVPDCMAHTTLDDFLAEAFRSRDGWQVEVSCRLAQGKAWRRRGATGLLLADFSLAAQLSIDVVQGSLNKISLKVADPSISLSSGLFSVLSEHRQRKEMEGEEIQPMKRRKSILAPLDSIERISHIDIQVNNCTVKYIGTSPDQTCDRYLSLNIRDTSVGKREGLLETSITGLTLVDQLHRSNLNTSQLSVALQRNENVIELRVLSDSVHTSLAMQDAIWWKSHVDAQMLILNPTVAKTAPPSPSPSVSSSLSIACSVEVASFVCDIVDADSFQSTLFIQFLTFSKMGAETELGVDSLCLTAAGIDSAGAVFDRHQWGHSVYIGVALVQYTQSDVCPSLLIGVDDCKLEWSDKLSQQIGHLLNSIGTDSKPRRKSAPARQLDIRATTKRAAVFSVAKDSTFLILLCDEFSLGKSSEEIVLSVRRSRLGIDAVRGEYFDLNCLRRAVKEIPPPPQLQQTCRRWNQKENDKLKEGVRKAFEDARSTRMKLCGEADVLAFCMTLPTLGPRMATVTSTSGLYIAWSPLLHRAVYHMIQIVKETISSSGMTATESQNKTTIHWRIESAREFELDLELPRYNRMVWRVPSLSFHKDSDGFMARSQQLTIKMNGDQIVTATGISISCTPSDAKMDAWRRGFGGLETPSNKLWTWSADSFHFYLPFEFNFAQVFDEFVNSFKWLKIVHNIKKKPFTAESPLPSDVRIVFKEVRLELEDDPFENLLQTNHELKEDEVYECERRRQMLAERLLALKKTNPLFPQSKMDELEASLLERNSAIYIERWMKSGNVRRPLMVSVWRGWEMRAFADVTLHGTEKCIEHMREFDPLSYFPDGMQFSTLWARGVEYDLDEWTIHFKDYPIAYLQTKDMHFFGRLVGAEHYDENGRSLREAVIPLPLFWETHTVYRNMAPLKFYYDMQCESAQFHCTYGPCWEPCLSMISLTWNNISAPSRDQSRPLPFWDKMRFLLHGRYSWLSSKVVTTMLGTPDPYNTTETVEFFWDEYGLDWALGEIRVRSGVRVSMRTANRYDDTHILLLPDLKMRVGLDWVCAGDSHDHHSVQLCAPHRLPHFSTTEHDSYRAFRSSYLDLSISFDVAAGSDGSGERLPRVLLYANTFRCIEFLMRTLTMKNRNVKKGNVFGCAAIMKPQLSKHFRNVQVSVNFPKFHITYWMSHTSDFGFRVTSDGLNLLASLRQTPAPVEADSEITRRRSFVWSPQHVSATLWGIQVHVFGEGRTEDDDSVIYSDNEDTFLFGLNRVAYVRENNVQRDSAVHRLTAHDLKASWTAKNRDACLSIADGVHRAHSLRRILSNDAIKILKLHLEDEFNLKAPQVETQQSYVDERGHRRGYSMSDTNQSLLNQLIYEANTKLVAQCEQTTERPADSLHGALQCTADDVHMINWQVDLLNSQVVLKGCERDGFLLLTAAHASLTQKVHRCVWRHSQLLGKNSWSSRISQMQYFAPVAAVKGEKKDAFRWLPREVIEEKGIDTTGDDALHEFIRSGEAVGGVVQPDEISSEPLQLQRIVSRCSCQIYFCYFSEELKTDALEETGVPTVERDSCLDGDESGVDCITLKHNMLQASTSSEQYEMMVDIVNNLVLYIDPKKKELAEHRRRLRFECQMSDMAQMRESIVEQQSKLREIVSSIRLLERQLFYLGGDSEHDADPQKKGEIREELEDFKSKQLDASDQLTIYISCYKQRQVEAARAVVLPVEDDGQAAVARRFEVCFEDCIWKLTENDGQIALAETQIRNFLYTRTMRIDNSGEHLFEVGSIRVSNLLPDTLYKDTLHRNEREQTRQPALRLILRDMAPVGGICVKDHFEVNICPMVVQLTYQFFEKMMGFFFPGRNIHNEDNLDSVEETAPKFSFTRRFTGGLSSIRSAKGALVERKQSTIQKASTRQALLETEMDDIDRMRERADKNNIFLYIKIPEVPFVVSYKGNKEKNIEDVDRFSFIFPLCEFHDRNWTWLDLSLAVKQRCKRVLLQQFMKQKLLRNRLTAVVGNEQSDGVSEEEKKKIALGNTSSIEKKKKK